MTYAHNHTEQRQSERVPTMMDISMTQGGQMVEGVLVDISEGGAKVRVATAASGEPGTGHQAIVLNIPRFGEFDGEIVWSEGKFAGIQFSENHKVLFGLIREAATRDNAA